MTIRQFLKKYHFLESDLLLAHAIKRPKEFLYLHPDNNLTKVQLNILQRSVKRRKKGEPIAYILGYKDFYGLRFKVNKSVLIPRPETEELVNKVLQVCKVHKVKKRLKILDMGTGSGCIAVSIGVDLKSKIKNLQLFTSDISEKALKVAAANAKYHKVKIRFVHSDLFQNIKGKFDIIVANLPYVTDKFYQANLRELAWEPQGALTDGTDNYKIYERFFEQSIDHIKKGSLLILEIDPQSKAKLSLIVKKYFPGSDTKFYKDYGGHWRYLKATI